MSMQNKPQRIQCKFCPKYFLNELQMKSHALFEHGFLMPTCSTIAYFKDVHEIEKKRARYWQLDKIIEKKTLHYIKRYPEFANSFQFIKTRGDIATSLPGMKFGFVKHLFESSTRFRNYLSLIREKRQIRFEVERAGFVIDQN